MTAAKKKTAKKRAPKKRAATSNGGAGTPKRGVQRPWPEWLLEERDQALAQFSDVKIGDVPVIRMANINSLVWDAMQDAVRGRVAQITADHLQEKVTALQEKLTPTDLPG